MDNFEQNKIPTQELKAEKTKELETQKERSRQAVIQDVVSNKKAADSQIESKTKLVENIFASLEKRTAGDEETQAKTITNHPEEVLAKTKDGLLEMEHPTIDDVSRALIISGLKAREVKSWLAANKNEQHPLSLSKKELEAKSIELSAELTKEEQKNFFKRLFRGPKRKAITTQLKELSSQTTEIDTVLGERQSRGSQIEFATQELTKIQQELALGVAEQLFQGVVEKNQQLKEKLLSPEFRQELNTDLIVRIILPKLDKLQSEGKTTPEEASEYVRLLRLQLTDGSQSNWGDPLEKAKAIAERREQMENISYDLRKLSDSVSNNSNEPADKNYDKIFDFLIRETTKEELEELQNTLGETLSSELREGIGKIIKGIIHPSSNWEAPTAKRKDILDLRKVPIKDLKALDGLERWPIVKKFTESSGIISREVFQKVEEVIIQRLFEEQLSPGGRESFEGSVAAGKMGALGNPKALPLMLQHIASSGPGHTNNVVVYQMERLLKESDPEALQKTLEAQPKKEHFLLQALGDKDSYMSRFGKGHSRYSTCSLLQGGDLTIAKEQLAKILESNGTLDEEKIQGFYLGYSEETPETLEPLLKSREEVEKIIVDSKLNVWTQSADKLLAALVNPKNGQSVAFPKRIIQEGLGISDEKMLAAVDHIFAAKTFKGSGFERETFLDGLMLLNSKEDGKAVLETLLTAYRGSKEDPKRTRRIFQLLSTLEGFGEYEFVMPNPDKKSQIQQEIADLQNQSEQTADKTERKKIKKGIETLETKLQNLIGLKGIEEAMTQQVVESACRRLDLPAEYRQKITENLESLMKSGVFEIIPSLAGKYDSNNEGEVKQLLKGLTEHIINGDFLSWRYSHERSEEQLAGLSDEQKEFWKKNVEPISIEIDLAEGDSDRRTDELKAAQEIIKNAKEHILDSQPNLDFSKQRSDALGVHVRELIEKIKTSSSEDEKQKLILEKRTLQAEASLIKGVLEIEKATPQQYARGKIITQARELREKITELNIPLAGLDIEQVEKIFTVGDIKNVTAYESDDPMTLLRVGVEPQETCQSWRNGGFNECLLAYVADSNKKVLNVADGEGKIIARSIIKLTDQRDENDSESKTQRKTLLVEKPYSLLPNPEVYRSFIRLLLTKAQGLDASITFGKGFNESTLKLFEEEAGSFDYIMNEGKLDVFIPQSLNKHEYSDTLGGKISWFNRYQSLDATTFEKAKV